MDVLDSGVIEFPPPYVDRVIERGAPAQLYDVMFAIALAVVVLLAAYAIV